MTKTVKPFVAQRRKKPRTRRVKAKKNVKVDARVDPALRERYDAACAKAGAVKAKVLRRLLEAYAEAVDAGLTGLDFELRKK